MLRFSRLGCLAVFPLGRRAGSKSQQFSSYRLRTLPVKRSPTFLIRHPAIWQLPQFGIESTECQYLHLPHSFSIAHLFFLRVQSSLTILETISSFYNSGRFFCKQTIPRQRPFLSFWDLIFYVAVDTPIPWTEPLISAF